MVKTANYANEKIYKVVDNAYEMCYIGSTIDKLTSRMNSHRSNYKKCLAGKGRNTTVFKVFDVYGVCNCKIELIELYSCNSLIELQAREGHHIRNTECVNKCIEGRTQKERTIDNRQKVQHQMKNWALNNQEKLKDYRRNYNETKRDAISQTNKKWRERNKEHIKERDKLYREKNKEILREKERIPFHCECGATVQNTEKARHQKTIKHHNWLKQQQQAEQEQEETEKKQTE